MEILVRNNKADYSASKKIYSKFFRMAMTVDDSGDYDLVEKKGFNTSVRQSCAVNTLDLGGEKVSVFLCFGSDIASTTEVKVIEFIDVVSKRAIIISAAHPSNNVVSMKAIDENGSCKATFTSSDYHETSRGFLVVNFTFSQSGITATCDGYSYGRHNDATKTTEQGTDTYAFTETENSVVVNPDSASGRPILTFMRITNDDNDVFVAESVQTSGSNTDANIYDYISDKALFNKDDSYRGNTAIRAAMVTASNQEL